MGMSSGGGPGEDDGRSGRAGEEKGTWGGRDDAAALDRWLRRWDEAAPAVSKPQGLSHFYSHGEEKKNPTTHVQKEIATKTGFYTPKPTDILFVAT